MESALIPLDNYRTQDPYPEVIFFNITYSYYNYANLYSEQFVLIYQMLKTRNNYFNL